MCEIFKGINFEFTLSGTPERNGIMELGFDKLYSRMRAKMGHKGVHKNTNTGLWPELAATMTKIETLW